MCPSPAATASLNIGRLIVEKLVACPGSSDRGLATVFCGQRAFCRPQMHHLAGQLVTHSQKVPVAPTSELSLCISVQGMYFPQSAFWAQICSLLGCNELFNLS